MKRLNEFVLEKLKVAGSKHIYYPNSKEELVDLIIKEIEMNGPNCSLNHIDVSNITDMSYLFRGGENINHVLNEFDGDISNWDVSNVTDMSFLFYFCYFNGKNGDISNWDVSHVTNMSYMFMGNKYNGDISNWDVSNVTDMLSMFYSSTFNGDISNWDVSKVEQFKTMFKNSRFNGDISKWKINPRAQGNMQQMFENSPLANTPPDWYYKYV